ncbi:hypothetical protein ERX46_06960 [Brumimicrobium glaciale]|uniref:Lipoprotein n=1 Tax=Brumimicrobium glaciale TaxID=200475 RepID=A0A4Q4KPZ3_9FLAO|nr:hypothetical protein [Brumimicrobium glaciale]RYM35110.1 hypothetical protein ERX46_06960 [Brumimicrobium glaciale]
MKKVLFIGMIFGGLALTSCKKDYVCKFDSAFFADVEYPDLKKSQADTAETQCKAAGGTWTTK